MSTADRNLRAMDAGLGEHLENRCKTWVITHQTSRRAGRDLQIEPRPACARTISQDRVVRTSPSHPVPAAGGKGSHPAYRPTFF
jgi:hypothetical protein